MDLNSVVTSGKVVYSLAAVKGLKYIIPKGLGNFLAKVMLGRLWIGCKNNLL
jgi:hypothetical protein